MQELAPLTSGLPQEVEDLVDFILVGEEVIKAFKAKLRATKKANIAKIARDQALNDGRKCSKLVIEAESRLGEILEKTQPKFHQENHGKIIGEKTLPVGLDKRQSHYAQEIYRNPDIVEEVFKDYETKEDIPTKHEIIKRIKEKKRNEKIQQQKEEIIKGIEQPNGLYDIIVIDPPWNIHIPRKNRLLFLTLILVFKIKLHHNNNLLTNRSSFIPSNTSKSFLIFLINR